MMHFGNIIRYFYIASLLIPSCLSEICNLCPDGSFPSNPSAKFVFSRGLDTEQVVNCSFAYELALDGMWKNCDALHNNTPMCECQKDLTPHKCNLCGENLTLPFPERVVAGRTCAAWEIKATKDFEDDCHTWRKTMGFHCGCDISTDDYFNGFCRLCDEPLPDYNTTVTYTNGDVKFCAEIEQDINTRQDLNCSEMQDKYENACECNSERYSFEEAKTSGTFSTRNFSSIVIIISLISAAAYR